MLAYKEINALFCLQQTGEHEIVQRPGDEGSEGRAFLAFDNQLSRFVTIDMFSSAMVADLKESIEQRVELASQIVQPNLPFLIDYGRTAEGDIFVSSEFIEGEPLLGYLKRNPDMPGTLVTGLLLQICDAINSLKRSPRLLASIRLSDFWVCLDRGRLLSVRLGHYGMGRREVPISDFELLERWIQDIVDLHRDHSRGSITNNEAYGEILKEAAQQQLFLDDLPRLKLAVLRSVSLSSDLAVRSPVNLRSIENQKQVPAGLMFQMMGREGHLNEMIADRFQGNTGHSTTEYSPFSLHLAMKPEEGKPEAEPVSIYLVPPERLFVENIIEPVHRKMFDAFLRGHPAGFRIRSLSCETHFTYLTTACYEGFPLPCFQASRGMLRGSEALELMRRIHETLSVFEDADFDLGRINPWQIQICFEEGDYQLNSEHLMMEVPMAEWPTWSVRIRVEKPAETFVESCLSTWRYVARRMGSKEYPALLVWMLEQERFEWALSNGVQVADQEPLSWNPRLDALFLSALNRLDPNNAEQREKFLEYFDQARERTSLVGKGDIGISETGSLLTSQNFESEV